MNETLAGYAYLVAAVLFIVGLKRLSSPATAANGNRLAAGGMLVAVVVTLADRQVVSFGVILAGLVVGSAIGAALATRVEMTAMPQLVAAFNGFGGGASALVALSELVGGDGLGGVTLTTIALSVLIGTVTFSGSMIAFGKLQGIIAGRRIVFPGQMIADVVLAGVALTAAAALALGATGPVVWLLVASSLVIGVTRTLPIGGADMPVVISFLNSLSGLAASAAGFVIQSNALIVSGALVGAAGLILTAIMVRGMNRTLGGVLFSAFGADGASAATGDGEQRHAISGTPDDVAVTLAFAERVIVVPGYGLAVAQAQHALRDLADLLGDRGVDVRYAIHPVAGRMPGHMNVLLAEADVPYDKLFDLEDINDDFPHTDVALVVGANDVVNPVARESDSPISGMPILDVDKARNVVVVKRSLSPGFAGIDNPLFYEPNTVMLFADAKQGLTEVGAAVKEQ